MTKKILVLFGSTGDLAKLKIFPAVKKIKNLRVIAYSRRDFDTKYEYIQGELENLEKLQKYLTNQNIEKIYCYVALPPDFYEVIIKSIWKYLSDFGPKIALEKPFGNSFSQAKKLDKLLAKHDKNNFYLVDHYLAKNGVRNIKSQKELQKIKISLLETVDAEKRKNFYDKVGAIKDVLQSHLLNIITKILESDQLIYTKGSLKLGQYEGYGNSKTETYFKADFKFKDIDVTLESGKALGVNKKCIDLLYKNGKRKTVLIKDDLEKSPHQFIIEDFLSGKNIFSLTPTQAISAWKITEQVLKDKKIIPLMVYKKGEYIT